MVSTTATATAAVATRTGALLRGETTNQPLSLMDQLSSINKCLMILIFVMTTQPIVQSIKFNFGLYIVSNSDKNKSKSESKSENKQVLLL